MNTLVAILNDEGKLDEAQALANQVLASRIRLLGADHPSTLMASSNLADIDAERGDYKDAEQLFAQTRATQIRVLGLDNPSTAQTTESLATLKLREGNRDEALRLLHEAIDHGLPGWAINRLARIPTSNLCKAIRVSHHSWPTRRRTPPIQPSRCRGTRKIQLKMLCCKNIAQGMSSFVPKSAQNDCGFQPLRREQRHSGSGCRSTRIRASRLGSRPSSLFVPLPHPIPSVQPQTQSSKHNILWPFGIFALLVDFCPETLIFLEFPPIFPWRKIEPGYASVRGKFWSRWSPKGSHLNSLTLLHLQFYSDFPPGIGFR